MRRQELPGSEKDRQKSGFEKQNVPLKGHEVAAYGDQRKIADPGNDQTRGRRNSEHHQKRRERSSICKRPEEAVARVEPRQRGIVQIGLWTKALASRAQKARRGQDAVLSH